MEKTNGELSACEEKNSREVKAGRWPVNPISEGKKDGVIRRG